MDVEGIKRMPVLDGSGRLSGIISREDIISGFEYESVGLEEMVHEKKNEGKYNAEI